MKDARHAQGLLRVFRLDEPDHYGTGACAEHLFHPPRVSVKRLGREVDDSQPGFIGHPARGLDETAEMLERRADELPSLTEDDFRAWAAQRIS